MHQTFYNEYRHRFNTQEESSAAIMKVFFSHQLNDYVTDEMCTCGHFKSEHGSLLTKLKHKYVRQGSDGNCCDCCCRKFTFERFVTIEEKIKKPHQVNDEALK